MKNYQVEAIFSVPFSGNPPYGDYDYVSAKMHILPKNSISNLNAFFSIIYMYNSSGDRYANTECELPEDHLAIIIFMWGHPLKKFVSCPAGGQHCCFLVFWGCFFFG